MNKIRSILIIILSIFILTFTGCTNALSSDQNSKLNKSLLTVHYIDVGQGDSIFIELPDKKSMLIDAGEKEYAQTVIDYIKNQGYKKIDYIVATHPHSDHIGSMADVIKAFDFDTFYMPDVTHTSATYKNMIKAIVDKGKKATKAKSGMTILENNDINVSILSPVKKSYNDLNDYSVVIKITYKSRSFLFTGDIEQTAEKDITENLSADVLKVGHHGSSTSSSQEFLKKVNPVYAVISVGKDNDYGHPHEETINNLSKLGIKIYRTDEIGTIVISTDGNNIKVSDNGDTISGVVTSDKSSSSCDNKTEYIINTSSKKIHTADCPYVKDISEKNKRTTTDLKAAIKDGFTPCKQCNPGG